MAPYVDLREYVFERAALQLVSSEFCTKHRLIPILVLENVLIVGMADPTSEASIKELQFVTGRKIEPVLAEPDAVAAAISKYYGPTHS